MHARPCVSGIDIALDSWEAGLFVLGGMFVVGIRYSLFREE